MDLFTPCPLTPAGVAEPVEGENLYVSVEPVSLQTADKRATPYRGGLLTVTTLRLIWTDAARKSAVAVALSALPGAPPGPTTDISSPLHKRLSLRVAAAATVRVLFEAAEKPSRDRDAVATALARAVAAREWLRLARDRAHREQAAAKESDYVSGRRLGAAGVRDKVAQARDTQGEALGSGLSSLDGLRHQAADLERIARMLRNMTVARVPSAGLGGTGASIGAGAGASGGRVAVEGEDELLQLLAEMGMESPITKSATGGNVRVYREQLARQVGPFLRQSLHAVGGVMAMADAYCLVNRNRATTELVSPADFRAAAEQAQALRLGVRLARLESGVLAVEIDGAVDASGAAALAALARARSSVTAVDVMRVRNIPIQRARGMLEQAERLGMLARDETTDGVRFFANEFFGGPAVASQ